jgi:hypothetical protein
VNHPLEVIEKGYPCRFATPSLWWASQQLWTVMYNDDARFTELVYERLLSVLVDGKNLVRTTRSRVRA